MELLENRSERYQILRDADLNKTILELIENPDEE